MAIDLAPACHEIDAVPSSDAHTSSRELVLAGASPLRDGEGLQRPLRHLVLALGLIAAILLSCPWGQRLPASGLDQGWMLGLNWARDLDLHFGSDFLFTYGPWDGWTPRCCCTLVRSSRLASSRWPQCSRSGGR